MGKYGLRVITRKNKLSGDNFLIIQYKLDCMKKTNWKKVFKWVVIIATVLGAGETVKPLKVIGEVATQISISDTIK